MWPSVTLLSADASGKERCSCPCLVRAGGILGILASFCSKAMQPEARAGKGAVSPSTWVEGGGPSCSATQ